MTSLASHYRASSAVSTVPPPQRRPPPPAAPKTVIAGPKSGVSSHRPTTSWDEIRHDYITQDRLHSLRVGKEEEAARLWQVNWAFLADYDPKGQLIEREPLPEAVSRFSTAVPNTNAGNYGARVDTEGGRRLQNLEWQLIGLQGKRKIDKDINCNY